MPSLFRVLSDHELAGDDAKRYGDVAKEWAAKKKAVRARASHLHPPLPPHCGRTRCAGGGQADARAGKGVSVCDPLPAPTKLADGAIEVAGCGTMTLVALPAWEGPSVERALAATPAQHGDAARACHLVFRAPPALDPASRTSCVAAAQTALSSWLGGHDDGLEP